MELGFGCHPHTASPRVGWAEVKKRTCVQREREQEVARLKEERHQACEIKRKEAYVKECRTLIEEKRLRVTALPNWRLFLSCLVDAHSNFWPVCCASP